MKRNAILIVIDSLNFDRISGKITKPNPTPFLTSLMDKGISCEKMYSQAPYTEAALMGLICGCHTMDFNGYMKRYKDVKKTLPEAVADAGYEVYQYMQPHIYPSSLKRGLPHTYYDTAFDFQALWSYRLEYYAHLHDEKALSDGDYRDLIDMLQDNLNEWERFLENVSAEDESVSLIIENLREYNVAAEWEKLHKERCKFDASPKSYLEDLLTRKTAHPLFQIKTLNQVHKIKDNKRKQEIIAEYQPLFERIWQVEQKHGSKNGQAGSVLRELLKTLAHTPSAESAKNIVRFLRYVRMRRNRNIVMERIAPNFDAYKNAPSVQMHFDHFLRWAAEKRDKSKPFFAYLHFDDIHNPEMFFSYDSEDRQLLKEEFADIKQYLDALPESYKGSITYDLGLQYVDKKIKTLVQNLEKTRALADTEIFITADHGFSFYNQPLRDSVPNNFYRESYNVPFLIYKSRRPAKKKQEYCTTMDIPATILDELGIPKPETFAGLSIFDAANCRDCAMMEYMGGGCPDMKRRPIQYGIRNDRFNLVYAVGVWQDFQSGTMLKLFDLQADPMEQNNLAFDAAARQKEEVQQLLERLHNRHDALRISRKSVRRGAGQ